jgi:lipopolysaccharide export system protein LptA
VTLVSLAGAPANAQPNQGPANALQGFSANRGKPVRIQAVSLEVRDKEKVATFSGDVHVVQGDTDMRCKTLLVYYEGNSVRDGLQGGGPQQVSTAPGGRGATGSTGKGQGQAQDHQAQDQGLGQSQIRRMEAKGGVIVTQKDQVATGDRGEFDMRTNTVTLIGNVVVTKGKDVLKGQRLVVNLTTGVSRVDSGGGRVEMLMESKPERPDAKPSPSQAPLRLSPR